MAIFPGAISADSDLLVGANFKTALVSDNPLTIGATTVNVNSTTGFPTVGAILIDTELIKYTGTTGTSFTGCTRAFDSTTAASHVQNSQVRLVIAAAHHNLIKDEVKAIEQFISDVIGRTNTKIQLPDGTSGSPSNTYASQTTLGTYRIAADQIGFTAGGNIGQIGIFSGSAQFQGRDGSAASPYWSFVNDPDNGMWLPASNTLGWATAAVDRIHLDTDFFPITDATVKLGKSGNRWGDINATGFVGTTTNDNATAGNVGEEVRSSISTATNFPATGTYGDLTSISLTAGDWDINGIIRTTLNGATMSGGENLGISTNSGTSTSGLVEGDNLISIAPPTASYGTSGSIATWRLKLASTTTVYLKYKADFSAGTPQAFGRISARRRR